MYRFVVGKWLAANGGMRQHVVHLAHGEWRWTEAREAWEHRCWEGAAARRVSTCGQFSSVRCRTLLLLGSVGCTALLVPPAQARAFPKWWLATNRCVFCLSVQVDGDAEENRDVKQQLDVSRADWRGAGCLRVIVQVRLMRWLLLMIKRAGSCC